MTGNRAVGRRDSTERAAVELVVTYLSFCEEGRLDEAHACLALGATLTFPGNMRFTDLEDWFSYFRGQVRWVRKRNYQFDVCRTGEDDWVLVCRGELEGVTASNEQFAAVRFLDRFVVSSGRIVEQQVWNDMAVHGLVQVAGRRRDGPRPC